MQNLTNLIPSAIKIYFRKFVLPVLLSMATIAVVLGLSQLNWVLLLQPLQKFAFAVDANYHNWFRQQSTTNLFVLLPLTFIGGLVASISPCVLALLPVNLSYIGTREITSRWDALQKAGGFVLGVVTVLSLLGLVSSLAGLITIKYRGYVHSIVGLIIILMGLSLLGILRLPLPKHNFKIPILGSYGVGLTFALLSSPCTSPILFAVLAAAAASGSQFYSVLAMISYALGYTTIIFLASLFAGFLKQARSLLKHSETITRIGSIGLVLTGGFYLMTGMQWIVALLRISG